MIIALYFILAHLLADFAFQSNKLIKHKFQSPVGVLIHVAIHFATMTTLLLPVILAGYYWLLWIIFGICMIHFLLDQLKVTFEKRDENHTRMISFLLDQMFHFLTIAGFYNILLNYPIALPNNIFTQIYTNQTMVLIFIVAIFSTYTFDITLFQLKRDQNKNATLNLEQKKWWPRLLVIFLIFLILQLY